MYHLKRLDKNREYIYHFLNRMKKYNCPIAINCEFDVTDTLATIKKPLSLLQTFWRLLSTVSRLKRIYSCSLCGYEWQLII